MRSFSKKKSPVNAPFHSETKIELEKEGRRYLLAWYDYLTLAIRKILSKNPRELFFLFSGVFLLTIIISVVLLRMLINGVIINVSMPVPSFSIPNIASLITLSSNSSTAVYDPMVLLEKIKKGDEDYKLVDIRSFDEYEQGHIKTAISIPVYGTNLIKKDGSLDKGLVKASFKEKAGNTKLVIVYGQTEFSVYPQQVAGLVDKGGSKVKVLSIGWNEWAHFKSIWVPENKWDSIDPNDFIQTKE